MKQATLPFMRLFHKYRPARARADDPVESHAAADRMNKTESVTKQAIAVLKALELHGVSTAKHLDTIMPIANKRWDGWAHRRMPDLAAVGFVTRRSNGRMKICQITEKGKQYLNRKENQRCQLQRNKE